MPNYKLLKDIGINISENYANDANMEKNLSSVDLPNSTLLVRNIDAVQTYFKQTFSETKKEISEGLSQLKDGVKHTFNKTGASINLFSLPVNNFIKDITQIDQEFVQERNKHEEYCICLNGQMIPAADVAKMPMEENY